MKKGLMLKYGMNMCAVGAIDLPSRGFAAIAVPMRDGMALVCNTEETATEICKQLGFEVSNYAADRPVIMVSLDSGDDEGVTALNKCLDEAGFKVNEQGDIPWLEIQKRRR